MKEFLEKFPESWELMGLLLNVAPIPFEKFSKIPGITKEKLRNLHREHLTKRGLIMVGG